MAERKRIENDEDDEMKTSDDYLSTTISSSTLEIIMDEQSASNSANEDSNSSHRATHAATTNRERLNHRRRKHLNSRTRESHSNKSSVDASFSGTKKDPKSHRLIEKRRRDRMNACLSELLELTPHEMPETQRRIEKTEIIEMAIRHMRHLMSNVKNKDKAPDRKHLECYRTGYRNGLADLYEYLDDSPDHQQLLGSMSSYFKEKETDLANLTTVPNPKRTISTIRSDKPSRFSSSSSSAQKKDDEKLCVISEVEECKPNEHLSSIQEQKLLNEPPEANIKIPIFVLHPSGTHYIPMSIDSSIVSHAFNKSSSFSRSASTSSSSTPEQIQCHPVSIPVNFNPITSLSDPYELEIQNINVIGTRHQTSVRPN